MGRRVARPADDGHAAGSEGLGLPPVGGEGAVLHCEGRRVEGDGHAPVARERSTGRSSERSTAL